LNILVCNLKNIKYEEKHEMLWNKDSYFASLWKELSLCHKLWIYTPYIFGFQFRKSLIFETYIIWSNRIHILKYLRSTTLESKDIGFRKSEFVAKTQFLSFDFIHQRLDSYENYGSIFKTCSWFVFLLTNLILIFCSPIQRTCTGETMKFLFLFTVCKE